MVISPAKKLAEDCEAPVAGATIPEYLPQAEQLIDLLREKDSFEIAELMKLSMNLADLNVARYQRWSRDHREAKPALWSFRGDVYRGLDADALSEEDVRFAQQHLRILSGLYGLLRPLDRIHLHRLEMGTRLVNSQGANLYAFWGDTITEGLNSALREQGDSVLLNLASQEYFRSVRQDHLKADMVTPVFKERKNGAYKVIGVHAKRARGLMVRFVIRHRLRYPDDVRAFDADGYRWNAALSDGAQLVFTRG